MWVSHVGADDADNLAPKAIIPHDASDADVCTEFDKSLPSEPVQIEPEPVLQTRDRVRGIVVSLRSLSHGRRHMSPHANRFL